MDRLPPSVSKLLWATTLNQLVSSKASTSVPDQKGAEDEYGMLEGDNQLQSEVQKNLHHLQELCLLQHNELHRLRRQETQIGD